MSGRSLVHGLAWVPVLLILQGAPVFGQPWPPFASAYRSLTAGTSPASPVAADFDGDGRPDLAVRDVADARVLVFRNGVNGLSETPVVLELESPAEALAAADFDGVPEAIVLRILPEGVTILAGIPPPEPLVPELPASPELRITGVFPNPARAGASFAIESTIPGPFDVSVYDLRGRRLRSWSVEAASDGHACFAWDGRSDDGARCPSGRYFISATSRRTGLTARSTVTVAR